MREVAPYVASFDTANLDGEVVMEIERRLFGAALDGASPQSLASIVIDGLAAGSPGAICRVFIAGNSASDWVTLASPAFPKRLSERVKATSPEDPLYARDVASAFCPDAGREVLWREHAALCLLNGLKSFVAQPILVAGERVGAIAFYFAAIEQVDSELRAASNLARALALALRARLGRQSEQSADDTLKSLSRAIPGVIYQRLVTREGDIRYTYISDGAREMFGVEPERILSDPEALFQHYDIEYRRTFRDRLIAASGAMTKWDVEATIRLPDGQVRYTHAIARPQKLADGSTLWTGVILDASRIKAAETAAASAEANTRHAIVESLNQGMLLFDADDRLVIANSRFADIYPRMKDIISPGLGYAEFIAAENQMLLDCGLLAVDELAERDARVGHREKRASITERKHADDQWVMVTETYDPAKGSAVLYTDVSELKRRERGIHHLAYHDALTGLPNRSSFRQRLSEALEHSRDGGTTTAVLCLDLDGFKFVNDTLGHPAGDRLLMEVAHRLKSVVRGADMVARLGGDEFAIVIDGLPSTDFATNLSQRLLDVVGQPYEIDGQRVSSTTSVGIALARPNENVSADALIKNSDTALYRAKSDGRNAFRLYAAEPPATNNAKG